MNYAGVKAYYIRPNGTYAYGEELKQIFVLPIGRLINAQINYPINNTTWHNNQFRVLVTLPEDEDIDILDKEEYEYKEIEVIINNETYTYKNNKNIFSVDKLGYMNRVCINPSLINNFEDTDTYKIKFRVLKNYFSDNIWSDYSNEIILNKKEIENLNLVKDELIMAEEYQYVQKASERLWNCYPIEELPKENINKVRGDIILYSNYQAIYDTTIQIQNDVNNWALYDEDKENCKFTQNINEFEGDANKPCKEYITAELDTRPNYPSGRNYMNICINCMNKLK